MTTTEQKPIITGCDCFHCVNSNPSGAFSFRAVDISARLLWPPGTKYQVRRSDGVDFGQMLKRELLDMRAAYGNEIHFCGE